MSSQSTPKTPQLTPNNNKENLNESKCIKCNAVFVSKDKSNHDNNICQLISSIIQNFDNKDTELSKLNRIHTFICDKFIFAKLIDIKDKNVKLNGVESHLHDSVIFLNSDLMKYCDIKSGDWVLVNDIESSITNHMNDNQLFVCLSCESIKNPLRVSFAKKTPFFSYVKIAKISEPILLTELTLRLYNNNDSFTSFDYFDLMRTIRRTIRNRYLYDKMILEFVYNDKPIKFEIIIESNILDDSFDVNSPKKIENSFQSLSLTCIKSAQYYYKITNTTKLQIKTEKMEQLIRLTDIAGYQNQINALKDIITLPLRESSKLKSIGISTPKTVLVFGPQGTGKTITIKALMSEYYSQINCFDINCANILSKSVDESISKLKTLFTGAINESPSLLFLDNFEILCASKKLSTDYEKKIISTLASLLENIPNDCHLVIIAVTNKVDSIDMTLRRPGRIDREIEFHVPLPLERFIILRKHLNQLNCDINDDKLLSLAEESAHSFTGADLVLACREATLIMLKSGANLISEVDLKTALKFVRPSAMKEVTLEVPHVYWTDIAGMDRVKQRLTETVVWPLKNADVFQRMGIKPLRGVLMYGPPGCCKTMIGKALATESGLNFIAIKGPELFSKWVGESERAVREVFRRAKLAAPSILFFDEIDALAAERGGGQSSVGDRVLAQILTEIDGVESLEGVVIVAATNRPDMIDKALLRPGRLDSIIYVPLPDRQTRFDLFKIRTRNMPLDFDRSVDEALLSLADKTENYTGAEISAVCQEAALSALECDMNCQKLSFDNFLNALNIVKPRISRQMIAFYDKCETNLNDFIKK